MTFIITDILLCEICSTQLTGKQKMFCSNRCKSKSTNNKHQNYVAQQKRSKDRKHELVQSKGGKCSLCGYNRNYAALCFHHKQDKLFKLDYRSLANRSWKAIQQEVAKCELLCQNCHMETHYPDADD